MDTNALSGGMGQSLEELAQLVRESLPLGNTVSDLRANPGAGVVEFTWQARHFVVTPTLNVLELKGKNLFITGASMLMQTVLGKRKGKAKIVESMMESIEKVEDLLTSRRFEPAFSLLDSVKQTLKKETGSPNPTRPFGR